MKIDTKENYEYMKQFYDSPYLDEFYKNGCPSLRNNYLLWVSALSRYCQPPYVPIKQYNFWLKKRGYIVDPRYKKCL